MKRPSIRALRLSVLPSGVIEGVFDGGARRAADDRVAIVLDNTIHDVAPVEPGPKGTTRFSYRLPTHLIFRSLDVLGLPDGHSLLGMPMDMASTYALKLGVVGMEGPFITGSFTAAPFLAAELGVEFLLGNALAAQATAQRQGGGVPPV